MPSVLIVDDHPVVAEGWERIVRAAGACHIASAHSPLEGLRSYRQDRPEMLVMDISFGENKMAGIKLIRRLRIFDSVIPILVFSMHHSAIIARRALEAGSNGFINKDAPPDQIDCAFRTVRKGQCYLAPEMATQVAMLNRPGTNREELGLTEREIEVLGLISEGKSYREIADQICISYKTVANISYSLRSKLGASNLPALVVRAAEYFER